MLFFRTLPAYHKRVAFLSLFILEFIFLQVSSPLLMSYLLLHCQEKGFRAQTLEASLRVHFQHISLQLYFYIALIILFFTRKVQIYCFLLGKWMPCTFKTLEIHNWAWKTDVVTHLRVHLHCLWHKPHPLTSWREKENVYRAPSLNRDICRKDQNLLTFE